MILIVVAAVFGVILGALGYWSWQWMRRRRNIALAQTQAATLTSGARQRAQEILAAAQKREQEIESRIRSRSQKELANLQLRIKSRTQELNDQRAGRDREYSDADRELQKFSSRVGDKSRQVDNRQRQFEEMRERHQKLKAELIDKLVHISSANPDELKARVFDQVEQQIHVNARRMANAFEEEMRENADEMARRILSTVLARFPRAYCPERGIGVVAIPSPEVKKKLMDHDLQVLKALETACGVDVSIQEETGNLAVSGFDPVRRELATRSLEKLVTERSINLDSVHRIVDQAKQVLFKRIEEDGKRVAKELGQLDLHPEIKNMLGSLRYRYSFAQNQYFHVAEVGWLCGLLASELGIEIASAKRSGLLHDIGKAMDHSIEGGHAVIGADFIEQHGEQAHVVHAVRAHHFEEQPRTDLAFLVIAADAISGARPGARRSTVSSYNQKMEVLETIAEGFTGVTKTLVFNAGREVRVVVDGQRVNDQQSLVLCRQIADKVESELSYPGQIKIVVVRETHAEAVAK